MDKRRKRRVQGGWAATTYDPDKPLHLEQPRNSTMTAVQPIAMGSRDVIPSGRQGMHFQYKDPKEYKMTKTMPRNYCWLIPGVLAGSALPSKPGHLQYMLEDGVKHLVSLTERKPSLHVCPGLNHVHIPVEEFCPPSLNQAIAFVNFVEKAQAKQEGVAVHCHVGRGRTGTMLACYLVKSQGLASDEAIRTVRQHRPRSIETYEQEQLVELYAKHLQQERSNWSWKQAKSDVVSGDEISTTVETVP